MSSEPVMIEEPVWLISIILSYHTRPRQLPTKGTSFSVQKVPIITQMNCIFDMMTYADLN